MTPRTQKLASPDMIWPWVVRTHRYSTAICAALVVLGSAACWLWSSIGKSRPPDSRLLALHMGWLPDAPGNASVAWHGDVRAFASPVLFALPTPLGFSRDALSAGGLRPPPQQTQTNGAVQDTFSSPTSRVAVIARTSPQEEASNSRRLAWPVDESDAPLLAGKPSIVVAGLFAGASMPARTVEVATNSVWLDVQSWQAIARVGLDAQGWPIRVLLEKPTTITNRNVELVRLLRTMNFGAAGAREGRVAVRYEGTGGAP